MVYILFIIGFVLLIKGADLLVDGSSSLAKRFNISELVIGLTVVAFGTSAPELVVNVIASINGNPAIAIGNILGSNIVNILLILGISAVIFPLKVNSSTIFKEIPFSILAISVLLIMTTAFGNHYILSRGNGLILLCFFVIFLYYVLESARSDFSKTTNEEITVPMKISKSVIYITGGLIGLVFGGQWVVNGAVEISTSAGIPESFVGLTIVALGTSLPELATSVVAAVKKKADIAVGNIVGSNIFNIFGILGVSAIINPLTISESNILDMYVVLGASLLLMLFIFTGKGRTLNRVEGAIFVLLYVAYTTYLVLSI